MNFLLIFCKKGKSQINTSPLPTITPHSEASESSLASILSGLGDVATICWCMMKATIATRGNNMPVSINFSFHFFIVLCRARCRLTSRAQARGADDVLRDSGTGRAIPRCLQRFVRPLGSHVNHSRSTLAICNADTSVLAGSRATKS